VEMLATACNLLIFLGPALSCSICLICSSGCSWPVPVADLPRGGEGLHHHPAIRNLRPFFASKANLAPWARTSFRMEESLRLIDLTAPQRERHIF
jgi:hypothetical protein